MHSVSLQPIYDQLVNPLLEELLKGIALGAAGWLLWLLHRLVGMVAKFLPSGMAALFESKAARDLNTALANGVAAGMHEVENIEQLHQDVQVKGALQAFAVKYAVDHAPEAIEHFGLNPDQLALKALAYIPSPQTNADTTGATVKTLPVQTAPLAPVS